MDDPTHVQSTSLKAPFSNATAFTQQDQNLKIVDQKKPKGKGSPWKAPWLNLDHRNKQRHVAENVVKSQQAAHTNKPPDVAAILKNKLDATTVDTKKQTVTGHATSPKSESLRSISGKQLKRARVDKALFVEQQLVQHGCVVHLLFQQCCFCIDEATTVVQGAWNS